MRKHKNFYIVIFSLLIIFVMSSLGIYKCPSYFIFGISCPTCGITRALGSLLLLDINKAFYYHALWPLVIIGLFIYIFGEFDIIKLNKRQINIIIYVFAFIFFIYYIIRIIYKCPITMFNFKDSLIYKIYLYIIK